MLNLPSRILVAAAASALMFANPLSATANSHVPGVWEDALALAPEEVANLDMQGQGTDWAANNRQYATKNFGRWRTYPRSMILMIRGTEAVSRSRPGGGGGNGGGGGGGGNGGGNGGGRPGRL